MIRHLVYSAFALWLPLLFVAAVLSGCCTSTLQRGCDPMPKWQPTVRIN